VGLSDDGLHDSDHDASMTSGAFPPVAAAPARQAAGFAGDDQARGLGRLAALPLAVTTLGLKARAGIA